MKKLLPILFLFLLAAGVAHASFVTQTFLANGTISPGAGTSKIFLEAWGGGAGACNATGSSSSSGAGGAGAYSQSLLNITNGTYNISVGTGGAGSGQNGTSSWFNSTTTFLAVFGRAPTVAPACTSNSNGGAGGTAANSVGQVKFSGGNGGNGNTGVAGTCGPGGGGSAGDATAGSNGANAGSCPRAGGTGGTKRGANGGDGSAASPFNGGFPGGGGGGLGGTGGTAAGAGANGVLYATPINSSYSFVNLSIYDSTTLSLVSSTMTVLISPTRGGQNIVYNTTTGNIYNILIADEEYSFTISGGAYISRQFFVTGGTNTTQQVNVYMGNATSTLVNFQVKNLVTGDLVQGAYLTIQQLLPNATYVTLDQRVTDFTGTAASYLVTAQSYLITVTATGYTTRNSALTVSQSSYVILLDPGSTQNFTTYANEFSYLTTPTSVSKNLTNFSLSVSSPSGKMEWFSLSVILNGSTNTTNVTGIPAGGFINITKNLTNFGGQYVTAIYMMKSVGFTQPLVIRRSWYIYGTTPGNYTLSDFMTHYSDDNNGLTNVSRPILLTIGAVIIGALLGFIFGGTAAVFGASIVFIVGGIYGWLHWSIIIIVAGGLLGAILLKGRGT